MTSGQSGPWWQDAPNQLASLVQQVQRQFGIVGHSTSALKPKVITHARASTLPHVTAAPFNTTAPSSQASVDPSSWSASPIRSSQSSSATSKAELGRATWVLLHTLAAQFPAQPTKHQRADAKTFITSLAKVYPCGECAQHFQQVVRNDPPDTSDREGLQQWVCRLHNSVNRKIGKPVFNCQLVGSRWAALDCGEDSSCDMLLGSGRRK